MTHDKTVHTLLAQIRQVKLKARMIELLHDGITRSTIEQALREFKHNPEWKPKEEHCPRKARAALINACKE